MKKLLLKRSADLLPAKEYKIRYHDELNEAQYRAVMHGEGAALIIAGAGTGKTRTLVYRVARLIEDGVPPEAILLLTFTRKSASEMLRRASMLLDGRCERVAGGTFHSFAHQILRKYAPLLGFERNFSVLDQADAEDAMSLLRARSAPEQTKRRFPQKHTLNAMYSASLNKITPLREIIEKDYPRFSDDYPEIQQLLERYIEYKRINNMMDYDDLLVYLLTLLKRHDEARAALGAQYRFIMVDEYQDTNRLQHEIIMSLAGTGKNVIAVGDDAQSIYSFRGADFQNIYRFPQSFDRCDIITIEENYRSTEQILTLANAIMEHAAVRYDKTLFTRRKSGENPLIINAKDERQQSSFIVQQILELRENRLPLGDIAVLFRSGYMSFDLEIELSRANVPFKKFGGMKFVDSAHIKDLLAMFRILYNPKDVIGWHRVLLLLEGVGPRTAAQITDMIAGGTMSIHNYDHAAHLFRGRDSVASLFEMLREAASPSVSVGDKAHIFAEFYRPILKRLYDDFGKRWKDIEVFQTFAERYATLQDFLSDMALEPPSETADAEAEEPETEFVTLSTIHSAKGLEWNTVFVIWALDGKFPPTKSLDSMDSVEEERRLMYVAVTRAKERLFISYPSNVYDRETGFVLGNPSRFFDGIGDGIAERCVLVSESAVG